MNLAFATTTAAFIYAWASLDTYSETTRTLVKYVVVQGHLATENVLAAWYSSMLLLAVALAALAAHSADGRREAGRLRHGWIVVALVFLTMSLDEIASLHERIGMVAVLGGSSRQPMGWASVLAAPIAVIALLLVAFAWRHVRIIPSAFRQMAAGVALFVSNPAFERVEMRLLQGGAPDGTWQRMLHDGLLVVEEGLLELFGTLFFASGVVAYVAGVTGGRIEWRVHPRRAVVRVIMLTSALSASIPIAGSIVSRLPRGDTGIAANWFPAAAFFLLAAACVSRDDSLGRVPLLRGAAALAVMLSAYFGAGIYGYTNWGIDVSAPHIPIAGTIAAGAATAWVARLSREPDNGYRRSPSE